MKRTTEGIIREKAFSSRDEYEKVISDSVKKAALERRVVKDIVSEIGHASQDWSRDLGRIAETELQDAFEYGKAIALYEEAGEGKKYYKTPFPGACRHCITLYLTRGVGSEPILFTYQELLENGTNIGRKTKDWKAVLGTVHPFCRCPLHVKHKETDEWDEKLQMYVPKEKEKSAGQIKIAVGDKILVV
ncbi:MAG: hypothetical protein EOM67_13100 [Spirochaetia bacterium]|nr:hypothetical protein [Spirochaetia bacterium]